MKWRSKNKREFIPLWSEQQRAEKLAELGIQLRQARQEQGFSLEQVAAKTLIQRRLLQAIEAGQLDELPEPIYIQSFIKQYADALGLNGAELSSDFPTTGERRLSIKPLWKRLPAAQLRPIHLYLIYIFVIICAVNSLSQMLSRSDLETISSQPVSEPTQLPPSKKLNVNNTPSAATKISKPVRIDVNLKESSWVRVVVDGKTQFEGVLPEGTQRTWVAQEQLTVRAGNAGGVVVTFNQEEAKQMGNPGQVEEVTFAAPAKSY